MVNFSGSRSSCALTIFLISIALTLFSSPIGYFLPSISSLLIPFHILLLFFSILLFMLNIFSSIKRNVPVIISSYGVLCLSFCLIYFILSMNSDNSAYASAKVDTTIIKVSTPVLCLLAIDRYTNYMSKFKFLVLIGGIFSAYSIVFNADIGQLYQSDFDTINYARACGVGLVTAIFLIFTNQKKYYSVVTFLFSILFLAFGLINGSQRGPLISFIIALFFMLLFGFPLLIKKKLSLFIMIFLTCAITFLGIYRFNNPTADTTDLISRSENQGQLDRTDRYSKSLEDFRNFPLIGTGIGDFSIGKTVEDGENVRYYRDYAHNIFLEVLGEGGIVLMIFFLPIVLLPLYIFIKYSKSWNNIGVFAIFVYYLANAQFSGDMSNNAPVFVVGVILIDLMKRYQEGEYEDSISSALQLG